MEEQLVEGMAAGTDFLEGRLRLVTHFCDIVETGQPAGPFESVQGAEDPIDQGCLLRALLEGEQGLLELLEELPGLVAEGVDQTAHAGQIIRTTARSCSGLNGLTIHPEAPAAFPSCFFSG